MRFTRTNTLALLIDVQEKLYGHIAEHEYLEHNLQILLQGLEVLGVPVLATEQYTKGLGPTLTSLQACVPQWAPMEKMTFSCWGDPAIQQRIAAAGRPCILLMGVETHICVLQTALDLALAGYQVALAADCTSSRKVFDKAAALERMKTDGVVLTTYESVLFELCQVAGTPEFKKISALVK